LDVSKRILQLHPELLCARYCFVVVVSPSFEGIYPAKIVTMHGDGDDKGGILNLFLSN
jgi:hypothetical protein